MKKSFFFFLFIFFLQKSNAQQLSNNFNLQRINSSSDEQYPFVSPDGQHLFFVRNNHESNIGDSDDADIWMSDLQPDATWSSPVNLGFPINNEEKNIICGISLDASVLYFTNGKNIYFTKKKGRVWTSVEQVLVSLKSETAITAFVSIDQKTLIFAAKNEQSVGENDLFIAFKGDSSKWSLPISMGQNINTIHDENNVFLSADNQTIYFCSNRPGGNGGYDWYSSMRLDDTWQKWAEPKNMGANINTSNDDRFLSFSFDGKKAFAVQKEKNSYDIKYIPLEIKSNNENIVLVNGKINYAEKQQNALPSLVKWQSLLEKKAPNTILPNAEGKFQLLIPDEKIIAFFGLQKDFYSTLSYINFGKTPLKTIDYDSNYGQKTTRDSLDEYKTEMLLIRIRALNTEITEIEEHPFKVEKDPIIKYEVAHNFGADAAVEKLKEKFEQNDKIITILNEQAAGKNIDEDGLSLDDTNNNEHSMVRQLFEQYKILRNEKTIKPVEQNSISNDDRAAIDDIAAIEGAIQKRQFADFQELTIKVREDITKDIFESVQLELYKSTISEWSNWASLNCSLPEERLLEKVLLDKKRLLIKQYEQRYPKNTANKNTKEKEEIEQNLYNVLLPDVRSSILIERKKDAIMEVNWYMNFLLKTALRSELQTALQINIRRQVQRENIENNKRWSRKTGEIIGIRESSKNIKLVFHPIEVGEIIPLEGIFFAPNSSEILPESALELERLKNLLSENPKLIIEIRAHTSSALAYNTAQSLSVLRASEVRDALTKRGIFPDKINFNGYGKFTPLVPNNSLENRLKNQRLEFKVLAK
jgi:outer membrane protein OmpA-like peptidoglycan-associated protein